MEERVIEELVNFLEKEITKLKEEIDTRTKKLNTFEHLVSEFKDFEDYSEYKYKYEEIIGELDKEKEHLNELNKHYKNMENECQDLRGKVKGWQHWFAENKDIYNALFSSAPPSAIAAKMDEPPTEHKSKKKRKKLGRRKKK